MWMVKWCRFGGSFLAICLVLALVGCGGGSSNSNQAQVSPPSISQQPVGPSIKSGQDATLSVTASGNGTLSYQWYQGPSGTTSNAISGATSNSYTTPALTATTSYWVQVTDSNGSTNSNTAVVLIAGPRQVQGLMYTSVNSSGSLSIKSPGAFLADVLPHISGVAVSLPWSAVDTTSGDGTGGYSYDFTAFDTALQQFFGQQRMVNLIVWPATEGGSNSPTPGDGGSTPAYVFSAGYATFVGASNPQDMTVCQDYKGDSGSPYGQAGFTSGGIWNSSDPTYGSDLSGLPVSYELPFMTAYQHFITQVIQHYNGNPNIGYIRFGFSQGGENSPECNQYWPNFTQTNSQGQTTYLSYIQTMTNFVKQQNPSMTILGDLHSLGQLNSVGASTYVIYADAEAQYATAARFGFGTNGLQKADTSNFQNNQPCDSDWCNLFTPAGGFSYSPTLSLQTLQWTDPTDSDSTNPTGSLTDVEPFAKAHGANNLELYQADLGIAFDTANYASYPHAVASLNVSSYSSSYAAAIQDFLTP
jgi:hypothetical protein